MTSLNRRRVLLVLTGAAGSIAAGRPKPLVVMVSGAFSTALDRLMPTFEGETGAPVTIIRGASMGTSAEAIPNRLARGERADVVILARESLQRLIGQGLVQAGSDVDLVKSPIALAVRAGNPTPDVSTVDGVRQALLAARSVGYSDSASGVYVKGEMFQRLGIAAEMALKASVVAGRPVGRAVAAGEHDIGFQQLSELLPIQGITVVGVLPAQIQRITLFSAGIVTGATNASGARALIGFLSSPKATAAILESGLRPAREVSTP